MYMQSEHDGKMVAFLSVPVRVYILDKIIHSQMGEIKPKKF